PTRRRKRRRLIHLAVRVPATLAGHLLAPTAPYPAACSPAPPAGEPGVVILRVRPHALPELLGLLRKDQEAMPRVQVRLVDGPVGVFGNGLGVVLCGPPEI